MCIHVFYRTSLDTRICGYCGLIQQKEVVTRWVGKSIVQHKSEHLQTIGDKIGESGHLLYDSNCDKCKYVEGEK